MNDNFFPPRISPSQDLIDLLTLAQQVQRACVYARHADRLLAMQHSLACLGQRMEAQGALNTRVGEDYAVAVLAWLEQAFPADLTETGSPRRGTS